MKAVGVIVSPSETVPAGFPAATILHFALVVIGIAWLPLLVLLLAMYNYHNDEGCGKLEDNEAAE
jgi:hypothetical protein